MKRSICVTPDGRPAAFVTSSRGREVGDFAQLFRQPRVIAVGEYKSFLQRNVLPQHQKPKDVSGLLPARYSSSCPDLFNRERNDLQDIKEQLEEVR